MNAREKDYGSYGKFEELLYSLPTISPYREFEWFFGAKKKKTVLAGLRLKKQQWEMRLASWRHNCTGKGL
jgi:hypothetical protein